VKGKSLQRRTNEAAQISKMDEGDAALVLVSIAALIIAIFVLLWERI
jgi:hypothetical protein